jgi:hypothetical protein
MGAADVGSLKPTPGASLFWMTMVACPNAAEVNINPAIRVSSIAGILV